MQEIVSLTVVLFFASAKSVPAIDFCNGTETSEKIDLRYLDTSVHKICHCVVNHTNPVATKIYTVKSRIMKSSSDRNGFYRLSFTSGGRNRTIVDESIVKGTIIFNSSQTIQTNIYLDVSNSTIRPQELKIRVISGATGGQSSEKLRIVCQQVEDTTRETTSVTTTPSTQPPSTSSTSSHTSTTSTSSLTSPTSTTLDHPSSSNQAPTSTMGALALPDTADKDSDSTIPIAFGVIGGLLCIAIAIVIIILVLRRRRRQEKDGEASKTSHDNPMYGAPVPDVIYDVANHNDAVDAPSNPKYLILEGKNGNEGKASGRQRLDKHQNSKMEEEDEDCYNHANIATGSENRSKGDNYVNVPARTRQDYDHIKPNAGFSSGQLSQPSEKDEDTYDHTCQIPLPNMDSDNCYNHLGQFSSESGTNLEDCYNHVGQMSSHTMTQSEDCYNHLGSPLNDTESEDCYDHLGQ